MDTDFEIEIYDSDEKKAEGVQLPVNFLAFGEIANDDVKVYIKQDVYKELEKLSSSDTSKELGSILLGDYSTALGKTSVVISECIEAKYTDASASTLTFTHETWDYVYKEQKNYPKTKIVGWQHTHPGYGIFLSNYDLFIHENFFNLPFQIAYVIDPVQNLRGFFQWKNGKIEKLRGYYIYDEIGKPIKISQVKKETKDNIDANAKSHNIRSSIIFAVVLIAMCVGILSFVNEKNSLLTEKLQEQMSLIQNQQEVIDELQNKTEQNSSESSESERQNSGYVVYVVKSGDTLSEICKLFDIDYTANKQAVLAVNHIYDENTVYPGQVLILPDVSQSKN